MEITTVAQTPHVLTIKEVTNVAVWAGSQVTDRPVQVRQEPAWFENHSILRLVL